MSNLTIKPVESRREQKQFVQLAWDAVPWRRELDSAAAAEPEELVGFRPHPFHEVADVRTWLACRDGQVCGRIAGIVNHVHNEKYHEKRGFFGFFESIDDQQVAHGLFDAVRQWLAEQGIHQLRGPVNPSLNYEIGLLIEGFDSPPTFMMTYNPPYYAQLVESYGFGKTQDLYRLLGPCRHARVARQEAGVRRARGHAPVRHPACARWIGSVLRKTSRCFCTSTMRRSKAPGGSRRCRPVRCST